MSRHKTYRSSLTIDPMPSFSQELASDVQLTAFEASVAADVSALLSNRPGYDSISYSFHRLNGRSFRSYRGLH